jgi:hypothetical protein
LVRCINFILSNHGWLVRPIHIKFDAVRELFSPFVLISCNPEGTLKPKDAANAIRGKPLSARQTKPSLCTPR